MKKIYKTLLLVLLVLFTNKEFAQSKEPTKLFRVFEDDDYLNISGHGTDKSYSDGTRFDFFYEKKNKSRFFLDKLMPNAGDCSKNIYSWGLMQVMITPTDISAKEYQPNDYAYAGALFAMHSLYSYNKEKKYSFQTEVLAGVRGPASFAEQVQTGFHKMINYTTPEGWDNQLRNMPLLNINFQAEKQFFSVGNFMEVNGGALLRTGSLMDVAFAYPMIRIGKMSPYFDGYINQFGSFNRNQSHLKTQYYFVFKPMGSFVAYDALFQGKRENENSYPVKYVNESKIQHFVSDIQFSAVIAHGNFGLSYTQTYTNQFKKGMYNHSVGNASLYFRW